MPEIFQGTMSFQWALYILLKHFTILTPFYENPLLHSYFHNLRIDINIILCTVWDFLIT